MDLYYEPGLGLFWNSPISAEMIDSAMNRNKSAADDVSGSAASILIFFFPNRPLCAKLVEHSFGFSTPLKAFEDYSQKDYLWIFRKVIKETLLEHQTAKNKRTGSLVSDKETEEITIGIWTNNEK